MTDWNAFIDDLAQDDLSAVPKKKTTNQQRFPCGQCGGTGKWTARRRNRHGDDHCFACNGTGYFKTDPRKLAKQRQARRQKKEAVLQAFHEANADLMTALRGMVGWNDFAASLLQQAASKPLSQKQIESAERMVAKVASRKAEKAAKREAEAVEVDLSGIEGMFQTARESGYKKPMYRALGLRIKPHWDGPGLAIYTEDRTTFGQFGEQPAYEGKIEGGKFYRVRLTADDTPSKLEAIAVDPRGEAVRYGQKTGTCSCCGRKLSAHTSVEAGIGPVCAEKWGL